MKIERRDGNDARVVLTRMCVDEAVLGPIADRWDGKLFGSKAENLIAGWACEHYKKFQQAPGRAIGLSFDRWAESARDDGIEEFVGSFLQSLSDEYRKKEAGISAPVALDLAGRVFDKVRLERLREGIEAAVEAGDIERAVAEVGKFHQVEVATSSGYDVLEGGAFVNNALSEASEILIKWNQEAMRKFWDRALSTDEFIVFMGPEKRGKSFWLQETGFQGINCGCNVALFEVGDQSLNQITRRLIARAAGRPVREDRRVRVPVKLHPDNDGGTPDIDHEIREYADSIDPKVADKALRSIGLNVGSKRLKLSVHPNSSISVAGIDTILSKWEREGWRANVVIIDYLDLLAPMDGRADSRDQINSTWKALRAMNQRRHCLLVGATQSNSAGYDATSLDIANFSEDKRKNAHCTGMVGINQTKDEHRQGIFRLNWLFARDLEYGPGTAVYTAACLAQANPCVLSCW